MAQAVLPSVAYIYPVGTTVSAYAANRDTAPPVGVPPGAVVTTGVVAADGSLTFTGLTDDANYWAYAQVSGVDKTIGFSASGAAAPSAAESSRLVGISGTPLVAIERVFTETAGAGVYTGSVSVPAGATVQDITINGVALWNPATSALMTVGDVANASGYFAAVDLKATDLLAGESIAFALAGGKAGAYIANSQVSPRYSATARVISGIVTTVGGSGSTGRTRMTVLYSLPVAVDSLAATKV